MDTQKPFLNTVNVVVTQEEDKKVRHKPRLQSSLSSDTPIIRPSNNLATDMATSSLASLLSKLRIKTSGSLAEQYLLQEELGRGHFGVVRSCIHKISGNKFACKSVSKLKLQTKAELIELKSEISIMKTLSGHANIVSLIDVFEDEDSVHLVMELCKQGDLFDYILKRKRLSEKDASRIMRQLAVAVKFCHDKGVIHRDLKPENILFGKKPVSGREEDCLVKLADFGLAVRFTPPLQVVGMAGSLFYMAPELVRKRPYGHEVDIWSMGVILYTALSGFLPFWSSTHYQTLVAICQGNPDFEKRAWRTISPEAKSLVRRMLTVNPKQRATLQEVMNHPWILTHSDTESWKSNISNLVTYSVAPYVLNPENGSEKSTTVFRPKTQALSAPKGRLTSLKMSLRAGGADPNKLNKDHMSQMAATPPDTPKAGGNEATVGPFLSYRRRLFRAAAQVHADAEQSPVKVAREDESSEIENLEDDDMAASMSKGASGASGTDNEIWMFDGTSESSPASSFGNVKGYDIKLSVIAEVIR